MDLSDYSISAASLTLRPLMTWSFQLESLLFADWAPGYHILNFAAHLACCYLLIRFLKTLHINPLVSTLSGLLFALHPLATVPLWVLGDRAEVFVLLGGLIALVSYPARPAGVFAGLFIAFYSKESAITIPVWLAAYDVLFIDTDLSLPASLKHRLLRLSLPILFTGFYLLHRTIVFSGLGGYRSHDHALLNYIPDVFSQNIAWLLTLAHGHLLITGVFIAVTAILLPLTRSRTALFGLLWLLLFLLPTFNLCNKWYLYTATAALMVMSAGFVDRGFTYAPLKKPLCVLCLFAAVYLSVISHAELYHQKRNADVPMKLADMLKQQNPRLSTGTPIYYILPPSLKKRDLKGHYFDPRSFRVKADKSPIEAIVWDLNSTRYTDNLIPVWTRSVEAAVRLTYNDISLRVFLADHADVMADDSVQVFFDPRNTMN